MRDWIDLDCTPYDEPCEQLGPNYNPVKARREARAFIHQLTRQFGEPPAAARFWIASNPHDFGDYLSVRVGYDTDDKESTDYAYKVEANIPAVWDEIGKIEVADHEPMSIGAILAHKYRNQQ